LTETAQVGDPASLGDVSELFDRANEAYDSGDYIRAIYLLDECISREPSSVVAYNNKGAALDAIGRMEAAEECYRAAISRSPSYELAWHNLGNSLFAQERFRAASKAYTRAHSLDAGRVENLIGLAESRVESGRRRKANSAIGLMSAAAERDHSLMLIQADLYVLTREGDKAVERCERYISAHPEDVQGYVHLGGVRHEMGRYDEAISVFERALELAPDDLQIWNNLGYSYSCAGQTDRSLAAFDRAIEIDPLYKHAWYNKGYALHGVDRLEEAIVCYQTAVEIDSQDRVLLNNLGNALYNLGQYAKSIPMFVEAINVDPDYEIAWNNIGNALERMGIFREAIPFHDRALDVRSDFDYALYAKGVCKGAIGEPEEGYDLILESLDLNPSYDEAWNARSRMAVMLGRLDDALASVERSVTLNPRFCEGWIDRGDILLDLGDGSGAEQSYLQALRCLDAVVGENESDGEPWTLRARIFMRLARHSEALTSMIRAAESRHPDSSAVSLAFDLCRMADIVDPPQELTTIAAKTGDPDTAVAHARYLARKGDWPAVKAVLPFSEPESLSLDARLLLVRAYVSEEDLESATLLRESCPERDREEVEAELRLASEDWAGAVESLERVLSVRPGDHRAAVSLARAYIRAGRPREAIQAAEVASGIDPQDWEALETKAEACDALGLSSRAGRARERAAHLLARCSRSSPRSRPLR
jgi:tetratricopeptide (TPR) repeat protein